MKNAIYNAKSSNFIKFIDPINPLNLREIGTALTSMMSINFYGSYLYKGVCHGKAKIKYVT